MITPGEGGVVAVIGTALLLCLEVLRRLWAAGDERKAEEEQNEAERDEAWKRGDLPGILPARRRRLRWPWTRTG